MANMSYCQFENTRKDVNQCLDAIETSQVASKEEAQEGIRMFRNVLDFMEDYGVIEGYDNLEVNRLLHGAIEQDEEEDEE